jgi:hypothetical protein
LPHGRLPSPTVTKMFRAYAKGTCCASRSFSTYDCGAFLILPPSQGTMSRIPPCGGHSRNPRRALIAASCLWHRPPTARRCHVTMRLYQEMRVSEVSRKHVLECLRLESECRQLAMQSDNVDLQSHYVRMAGVWSALAENGPSGAVAGNPDS